jgi:hypothetical protein
VWGCNRPQFLFRRHRRVLLFHPQRWDTLPWGRLVTKMTPDIPCAPSPASGQRVPTAALALYCGCPSASIPIISRLAESKGPVVSVGPLAWLPLGWLLALLVYARGLLFILHGLLDYHVTKEKS